MKKFNEWLETGKKISVNLAKSASELGKNVAKDAKDFYDKASEQVKSDLKSKEEKIEELKEASANMGPEEFQQKFNDTFGESKTGIIDRLREDYSIKLGDALKDIKSFSDDDKERLFNLIGNYTEESDMKNLVDNVTKTGESEVKVKYYKKRALNI